MEVEPARGDHFFRGHIKQGDTILADDHQRFATIQLFQAEGLIDNLHRDDTCLLAVGNHQMTCLTDGIHFPVHGSEHIAEPVLLIVHHPAGLYLFPFYLVTEDLTKSTYRQQTPVLR